MFQMLFKKFLSYDVSIYGVSKFLCIITLKSLLFLFEMSEIKIPVALSRHKYNQCTKTHDIPIVLFVTIHFVQISVSFKKSEC